MVGHGPTQPLHCSTLHYSFMLLCMTIDQPGDPRLSKLSFRVQSHTFVAVDADALIGLSGLVVPAVSFQNVHFELHIITTIMFIGNVLP